MMNCTLTKKTATYADLEVVPPHLLAEIIDGELIIRRLPAPIEAAAATALSGEIGAPYRFGRGSPGDWILLNKPEVRLGDHVLVPDLAGWHREQLIPVDDQPYIEVAPEWVCEVISPSTEWHDRGPKRRIYAEAGVGHLWLLDPRVKVLEVFALREGNWLLAGAFCGSDEVSAPPFDAIAFSLGVLWPFDTPGAVAPQREAESGQ